MIDIHVIGAGPAGSAAALSALREGATVHVHERSKLPRHKVCGEFLSPEIQPLLEGLRVWDRVQAAGPAAIRRVSLVLGSRTKTTPLPEPALGLSRYTLDRLLLDEALERGATLSREACPSGAGPRVMASGRRPAVNDDRDNRLFGFKAHFRGPTNDAVELYFFAGCYVGINPVEGGITNVCGLGPRRELAAHGFDIDDLVQGFAPLKERLTPLARAFDWLHVGPLVFQNAFDLPTEADVYPAGDALSFVDPFTGSGQLCAFLTGTLAGQAAARQVAVEDYLAQCRSLLGNPLSVATLARRALGTPIAGLLAQYVPTGLLYRFTRPRRFAGVA